MLLALLLSVFVSSPGDACPFYVGSPPNFPMCPEGQIFDMDELIACQDAYKTEMLTAVELACGLWDSANTSYASCYSNALANLDTCMHDGIHNPGECFAQFATDVQACLTSWNTATGNAKNVYNTYKRAATTDCMACYATLCHPPHGVAENFALAQGQGGRPDCGDPMPNPPTHNNVAGYYDYPPSNYSCTGTPDMQCIAACKQAWLASTTAARATANAALAGCESTRYNAENAAYQQCIQDEEAAFNAYFECIVQHPGDPWCKKDYCTLRASARAGYYQAMHAAEDQYAYCSSQVLYAFVHATAAATATYNTCTAGCCHE
jgi:hypothetical protein